MSEVTDKQFDGREDMHADEYHAGPDGAPRWVWLAVIVLAAVSVLGLGIGWNATMQAKRAEQALANQSGQNRLVGQDLQALNQRLTQAEEVNTQLQNELVAVTDKMKMTQGEVTTARRQNTQIRDDYSKKLTSVQSELAGKANAEDVKSLGGDINSVKSQLESTRNNLDMTRTEFGTLIARNHDEIDQLRRVGERDYFEFTLTGKGNRSKVGDLMVELRGTNVKKNQFTVALYVDDLRLEKKNRAIDEPIYFYTRGTRAPLELVVNQIGKDKVVGYMSVPKAQPTQASAARTEN
jgi:predicted  nucleic acid-binding Zn-ribbon protein